MLEIKPLLHYRYFDEGMQAKSKRVLSEVRKLLRQTQSVNAMILAYKLVKSYIVILQKRIIYSKFGMADVIY